MKICSVGSALPPHEYSQDELTSVLEDGWKKKFFNPERLRIFHKNLIVGKRRFCVTLDELKTLDGLASRNDLFIKHAVDMGAQAIEQALLPLNLSPDSIDHIFFTSVTGIAAPSIDALLVNRMGFNKQIRRTPLFGLGCLGGAAGIARASDYLKAYPDQIALVLSVELCSLTIQKDDLSIANIVGTGLFGDGAAAVVMGGENVDFPGPRIQETYSSFYPNTERIMGWDIVDQGFKIVLSPNVPKIVKKHARNDLEAFLSPLKIDPKEIKHFICHPGGPKVLQAFQAELGLTQDDLEYSWKTLEEIGNLSSCSVLFVLADTLKYRSIQPGDYGLLMAMGPGFCSEWVLLQW